MTDPTQPGTPGLSGLWMRDPGHRAWLRQEAERQLGFFARTLRGDGGFDLPGHDGNPLPRGPQELHTTTRLVHGYALAHALGWPGADRMVDAGMAFLWTRHRDPVHGGYLWSVGEGGRADKLAYGHVFVLLAASSALSIGHPDAPRLFADVAEVIERRFWEPGPGRLADEFARDWQPFSAYRGMNSNMHGVEAFLAAHEATGEAHWLDRAGGMLGFFTGQMAAAHRWRIPEHYRADWTPDPAYRGDPVFRPPGTTPGHSLEFARLILQHWDLAGRGDRTAPGRARALAETALADAWLPGGGLAYTMGEGGAVDRAERYWWPLAEAIGAMTALLRADPQPGDETWYRRLWGFAATHFIDHDRGGWYPGLDADGRPADGQFAGKPDLYHSLQAALIPLAPGLSRLSAGLAGLPR